MESRTEQTELELASVSIGTKRVSFTDERNESYSATPPRDRAMPQFSVKTWLRTEIVALCILVVVVWILLSLPLLFYHLPDNTQVSEFCECRFDKAYNSENYCAVKRGVWLK